MTLRQQRILASLMGMGIPVGVGLYYAKEQLLGPLPLTGAAYDAPSPDAIWPWAGGHSEKRGPGIGHTWRLTADGTRLDLWEFNFKANPKLRWEIFDQDEDDKKPLDNRVLYWDRNVAGATKQLNARGRGPVWVAWNGAFFGYDNKTAAEDGFHVSPVVLRGKVQFNTANHRWAFGVKNTPNGPVWKTFFKPDHKTLEREFDYAAGSLQCLIKDGAPLHLEPFPPVGGQFKDQPVPSTPNDVGHIPYFDHMRTSRASIGWSRDNTKLYFLAVKEPDSEGASSAALSSRVHNFSGANLPSLAGGWTVPDLQKFWLAKGVWGAVNSDAGDVLQWVARRGDGGYDFVPPRQESGQMFIKCGPNWQGAVQGGGSLMYFFVRETQ